MNIKPIEPNETQLAVLRIITEMNAQIVRAFCIPTMILEPNDDKVDEQAIKKSG